MLRYELQKNNEKSMWNIYLPLCGIEHFLIFIWISNHGNPILIIFSKLTDTLHKRYHEVIHHI